MSELEFERFLQGEDRLAGLLQALPRYAPPPHMEQVFREQLAQWCATQRNTTELNFAPPPELQTHFMAEAARIQAAQAPRRAAMLQRLAQGEETSSVLGAEVSTATQQWLATQAAATENKAALPSTSGRSAAVHTPAQPQRKNWLWGSYAFVGTLFLAVGAYQLLPEQKQSWHSPHQETLSRSAESQNTAIAIDEAPAVIQQEVASSPQPVAAESKNAVAPDLASARTRQAPLQAVQIPHEDVAEKQRLEPLEIKTDKVAPKSEAQMNVAPAPWAAKPAPAQATPAPEPIPAPIPTPAPESPALRLAAPAPQAAELSARPKDLAAESAPALSGAVRNAAPVTVEAHRSLRKMAAPRVIHIQLSTAPEVIAQRIHNLAPQTQCILRANLQQPEVANWVARLRATLSAHEQARLAIQADSSLENELILDFQASTGN